MLLLSPNGYIINGVYSDVASGISFKKRKNFFSMLDDIIAGKVERVVISYKDRLSRVGYDLFYYLFQKFHCEIVVMSEVGSVVPEAAWKALAVIFSFILSDGEGSAGSRRSDEH